MPAFHAKLDELVVKWEDLCTPCQRTVRALLEQIGKHIDGVSPDRAPKEKKAEAKTPAAKKEEPAQNGPAPRTAHPAVAPKGSPARSS